MREEENCHGPYARCDAGDEQKARQWHAQESGGKIRRQSSAGDEAAENQNGRSTFAKPTFTFGNFRREAAESRTLEPSASGVTSERIETGVTHPDAEKARGERSRPRDATGGEQQTRAHGSHVFQYERC